VKWLIVTIYFLGYWTRIAARLVNALVVAGKMPQQSLDSALTPYKVSRSQSTLFYLMQFLDIQHNFLFPASQAEERLSEQVAAIRVQINVKKPGHKGPTTATQLWQHGIDAGTISLEVSGLTTFLLDAADEVLPRATWQKDTDMTKNALQDFVAPANSPRKDVAGEDGVVQRGTQSHFSAAMRHILSTVQANHRYAENKDEYYASFFDHHDLQEECTHRPDGEFCSADENFRVFSVPDGEAFNRASFLLRRPDCVFYDHISSCAPRRITFFGNVTPDHGGHFTDAEKGTLLDFGADFLTHVQPERSLVILFLTNTRGFQFFRIERNMSDDITVQESEYFDGVDAYQLGWRVSALRQRACF
jgi:hypothetical protein